MLKIKAETKLIYIQAQQLIGDLELVVQGIYFFFTPTGKESTYNW